MRLSLMLLSVGILTSCGQFQTGRSYLSEMDQDDSTYFNAGDDFPVLGGDSGRNYRNSRELKSRTPASMEDMAERRGKRSLKDELRGLVDVQDENELMIYDKFNHKFGSTSEKIFYLKLPASERGPYLESRGFTPTEEKPVRTPHERMQAKRKTEVMMGMSKNDVVESWGEPARVEVAGNPRDQNERWVYSYNGATKYIYFEGGQVGGWE